MNARLPVSKTDPLIEVDRVISELRRGASVRVHLGDSSVLMLAAEAVNALSLKMLASEACAPIALVMTGTRANVLGLDKGDHQASETSRLAVCDPLPGSRSRFFEGLPRYNILNASTAKPVFSFQFSGP